VAFSRENFTLILKADRDIDKPYGCGLEHPAQNNIFLSKVFAETHFSPNKTEMTKAQSLPNVSEVAST
jgi:hypothetical protein